MAKPLRSSLPFHSHQLEFEAISPRIFVGENYPQPTDSAALTQTLSPILGRRSRKTTTTTELSVFRSRFNSPPTPQTINYIMFFFDWTMFRCFLGGKCLFIVCCCLFPLEKQTSKQTNKQTNKQRMKERKKERKKQTNKQTNKSNSHFFVKSQVDLKKRMEEFWDSEISNPRHIFMTSFQKPCTTGTAARVKNSPTKKYGQKVMGAFHIQ